MHKFFAVYCVVIACALETFAQLGRERDEDILGGLSGRGITTPAVAPSVTGVALEAPIDPESYYVGPADLIAVNIWMSPPLSFNLNVTPEGTLLIPTVGEVRVAGMKLSAAKEKILAEVRRKYLTAPITATLVKPRPIIVTVLGRVLNPGTYTLTAADRAGKAIDEANRPSRTQNESQVLSVKYFASEREILVKHRDGTHVRADLIKYAATKSDMWNPYLREGDLIIVPEKDPHKNKIGVYGAVNLPGRFEYVKGDSIKDMIRSAHGFSERAVTDSIEFNRLDAEGNAMTTRWLDTKKLLDGTIADIALEPGDRLFVPSRLEAREDFRVVIQGEVQFPGTYPITRNSTKLSDIVKRAGGFTEFAAIRSAELHRFSISPQEIELERLLSLRGGVTDEDSAYYFTETELRIRKEIVNVDFEKLFVQKDSSQDVVLQSEDQISVPSVRKTVYVFGQVVSPGHIPYVRGATTDYYLRKAGGETERARSGDIKIVKAKTKQWLSPKETTIEEGDYIWVPKDTERPFLYYTTIVSQVATVLSAIVGVALVAATLNK
jgi:protein involved in polysaccharide export with SLBB domain